MKLTKIIMAKSNKNNPRKMSDIQYAGIIISYVVYILFLFTIVLTITSIIGIALNRKYVNNEISEIKSVYLWAIFFGGVIPGLIIWLG